MKYLRFLLPIVAAVIFMVSCDNTDTPNPITEGTITIDASDHANYTFFSFETGGVVDTATQEWDLGFSRLYLMTNSGLSGDGLGGAKDIGNVDFNAATIDSPDGFTVDTLFQVYIHTQAGPDSVEIVGNAVLSSCFEIQQNGVQTAILPVDKVYLVKAANGNMAKIKFYDYYQTDAEGNYVLSKDNYKIGGYPKFKFEYDADGNGSFD